MKRRVAKKRARVEAAVRRARLGFPKPCPPPETGELLVPDGYVGPVRITTPGGRVKIRYVNEAGVVFRDDKFWAGGRFHISVHARSCRVEVCTIVPAGDLRTPAGQAGRPFVAARPSPFLHDHPSCSHAPSAESAATTGPPSRGDVDAEVEEPGGAVSGRSAPARPAVNTPSAHLSLVTAGLGVAS